MRSCWTHPLKYNDTKVALYVMFHVSRYFTMYLNELLRFYKVKHTEGERFLLQRLEKSNKAFYSRLCKNGTY
jgi:hypothetical protein